MIFYLSGLVFTDGFFAMLILMLPLLTSKPYAIAIEMYKVLEGAEGKIKTWSEGQLINAVPRVQVLRNVFWNNKRIHELYIENIVAWVEYRLSDFQ